MLPLKVGADPELFVKQGGEFVSGYNLISGTKQDPFPVEGGAVQVDGMALEFNIDPAEDRNQFVANINKVMKQLEGMVDGYELAITPVATFSKQVMEAQCEDALMLGCEPDFNAWLGKVNPQPKAGDFRTAAGHVHVGWTENEETTPESIHGLGAMSLVKQLDYYLGLPSVLYDKNTKRRELYGKAGACRIKPYGVEYRVLSNEWLKNDKLKRGVYDSVKNAFENMKKGNFLSVKYGDIQEIINNSDEKEAIKMMDKTGVSYAAFL